MKFEYFTKFRIYCKRRVFYDLKYFVIYSNQDTFPKGHFSVCETWQDAMFDHATIGEKVWRISWKPVQIFQNFQCANRLT